MDTIRVLVVDDHPLMRQALCSMIDAEPDMEAVGQAAGGNEAVNLARDLQPDLILMDLLMPDKSGLEAIAEIRAADPESRVLALTSSTSDDMVLEAVKAGALGYALKDIERPELLHAMREVSKGSLYLPPPVARKLMRSMTPHRAEAVTGRETEILELMREGLTNRAIAQRLGIAEGTVRTHIHNILEKLELENRSQAVVYAVKHLGLERD